MMPSPWITRFAAQLPAGATVLDVACGSGRHVRWLAQQGLRVTGVDQNAEALAGLHHVAETVCANLEDGSPWPFPQRQFDAVVVTNYLWRPLLPTLSQTVVDGGWLLYETFAHGNADYGRPARPDFLLQPGELLQWLPTTEWTVVAYENGYLPEPERVVQRVAAVKRAGVVRPL